MEVRFFNSFRKRLRSTDVPSPSVYKSVNIDLKDRCSVEYPVLLLSFDPIDYNYVYIPNWKRYYFKIDSAYVNGLYEVKLQEDYLGSFRDEIFNTTAVIMYSHNGSNDIIDSRIPIKSGVTNDVRSASLSGITWLTSGAGTPMLAITGKGSNGIYALSLSDMAELLDGFDGWYNDNIPDYFTAIKQLAYGGSASDNIKGAFSLPFTINSGGAYEMINLGGYPARRANGTYIAGYKIIQYNQDAECDVSIPWHNNNWLRSAPYTLITIFLPLCGLFSISPESVKNDSSLHVKYTFNRSSGDFSVVVTGNSSGIIVVTSAGNCAMGLFVGSAGSDIGKITTGVGGGVATAIGGAAALAFGATGAAAVGAALAIGGGLAGAAAATVSGLGGLTDGSAGLSGGAAVNMGTDVKVFTVSKSISDNTANLGIRIGKPFFKNDKIGNHVGYVQCDGFQLSSSRASSSETEKINSYLDTGVYIE